MRKFATIISILFMFGFATGINAADSNMDAELKSKARRAVDDGLRFLREQQAEDGSWSGSVGITALGLRAFLESHRHYTEEDGAFITRPVKFIIANVKQDGSITESINNRNYNTAVSITALQATEIRSIGGPSKMARNSLPACNSAKRKDTNPTTSILAASAMAATNGRTFQMPTWRSKPSR